MLEILRQLRLRGARRPVAEDGAGCPGSGGALFVANDDFPGAHFPLFDQTTHDVRIFPGEFSNLAPVIDSKYQQSTVDGIIERAREQQFPPSPTSPAISKCLSPKSRPPGNIA